MEIKLLTHSDPDPEIEVSIKMRKSEWKIMNEVFGKNATIPDMLFDEHRIDTTERHILTKNLGQIYSTVQRFVSD